MIKKVFYDFSFARKIGFLFHHTNSNFSYVCLFVFLCFWNDSFIYLNKLKDIVTTCKFSSHNLILFFKEIKHTNFTTNGE